MFYSQKLCGLINVLQNFNFLDADQAYDIATEIYTLHLFRKRSAINIALFSVVIP